MRMVGLTVFSLSVLIASVSAEPINTQVAAREVHGRVASIMTRDAPAVDVVDLECGERRYAVGAEMRCQSLIGGARVVAIADSPEQPAALVYLIQDDASTEEFLTFGLVVATALRPDLQGSVIGDLLQEVLRARLRRDSDTGREADGLRLSFTAEDGSPALLFERAWR